MQPAIHCVDTQKEAMTFSLFVREMVISGIRCANNQTLKIKHLDHVNAEHLFASGETKNGLSILVSCYPWMDRPVSPDWIKGILDQFDDVSADVQPDIMLIAGVHFDPSASSMMDHANLKKTALLKCFIDENLFCNDFKKEDNWYEKFWLLGEPKIKIIHDEKKMSVVEIKGMSFYDVNRHEFVTYNAQSSVAHWALDANYNGDYLHTDQAFFPAKAMKSKDVHTWRRLEKYLDQEKVKKMSGYESFPFQAGNQVAVKVCDMRGMEYLTVLGTGIEPVSAG